MKPDATYTNVNTFYIVTNENNEIYDVEMNWEDAKQMADYYNETSPDEGKFTFTEVGLKNTILITGRQR